LRGYILIEFYLPRSTENQARNFRLWVQCILWTSHRDWNTKATAIGELPTPQNFPIGSAKISRHRSWLGVWKPGSSASYAPIGPWHWTVATHGSWILDL